MAKSSKKRGSDKPRSNRENVKKNMKRIEETQRLIKSLIEKIKNPTQ
jgi:hypothetical protein